MSRIPRADAHLGESRASSGDGAPPSRLSVAAVSPATAGRRRHCIPLVT